jgi:SNF2 family DNA or RNA helicase
VVFFSQDWSLENHDQLIERVGPMRQMQAGLNRPVMVHYIVAKQTVDELVMARRTGKRSVQDLLMDYMKGAR